MTQQILTEISGKLSVLGIPAKYGDGTDITINTEFLDAGWSVGDKKISYEAAIFVNAQNKTVYMYEKTTEIGHGLSFGSSSGSWVQSGKTLFRKVKSVQYGPDGKVYEYNLDLGAIPKAVKETAKIHGWNFKIVINKKKAMYPPGYVPTFVQPAMQTGTDGQAIKVSDGFCSNCGMPLAEGAKFCDKCGKPVETETRQTAAAPQELQEQPQYSTAPQQPQYNDPQGAFYADAPNKSGDKTGTFGLIGFILLGLLLVPLLLVGKATPVGWVISLAILGAALFIQRKLSEKGCLLNIILWVATGFLLLVVMTIVTTDDISVTTANLKNAHMTTAMDANGKPVDKIKSYSPNAPELVAVAELHNAPSHTQVRFIWRYVTGNILISEYKMNSGDSGANVYVFSSLTNDRPWPEGEYEVELYIADRQKPDTTIKFTVSSDAANTLTGNSAPKHERSLTAIELDVPEPWHRTGDTSLKDNLVYSKDLYGYSSVTFIASSFKIRKEAYDGTVKGFEKYFIERGETHTIIGTPEKRKINDWNAVRCMVTLMPNDPKYYLFYFIDVEGENDVGCYVFSTDQTEVYKLADEWEKYWSDLKLIY